MLILTLSLLEASSKFLLQTLPIFGPIQALAEAFEQKKREKLSDTAADTLRRATQKKEAQEFQSVMAAQQSGPGRGV